MEQLPAPWALHDADTARPYWFRECEPSAAGLAAALAQLPPDTALETSTGPEQSGTPELIWYYPHLGCATI
jgi:hypothetical protein